MNVRIDKCVTYVQVIEMFNEQCDQMCKHKGAKANPNVKITQWMSLKMTFGESYQGKGNYAMDESNHQLIL